VRDRRAEAERVNAVAPTPLARNTAAFVCGLMVYLISAGGLFYYAAVPQSAILVGSMAGLFSNRRWMASAIGASAALSGWLLAPPVNGALQMTRGDLTAMIGLVLGSAAVAALVQWAVSSRGSAFVGTAVAVLVGLVIANVWVTALARDARVASVTAWLETPTVTGSPWSDDAAYVEVYRRVAGGADYYEAFRAVTYENVRWRTPPDSVLGVRPPALFWLLRLVAPRPRGVFYGLLALSCAAAAAAAVLAASMVRRQFAVIAAAATGAAFLFVTTSAAVIFAESWAAAFAVISLAALIYAETHDRWTLPFVAGVASALAAAMLREFYLCIPLAGLLSAYLFADARSSAHRRAWIIAVGVLALYYMAHFYGASRIIVPATAAGLKWFAPSPGNLLGMARFFAEAFGPMGWVVYPMSLMGISAAAAAPRGRIRALLVVVFGALTLFFILFRSDAVDQTGQSSNYWAIALMPILLACSPLAFGLVPGMRRRCAESRLTSGSGSPPKSCPRPAGG
jgi:hypothetical protein